MPLAVVSGLLLAGCGSPAAVPQTPVHLPESAILPSGQPETDAVENPVLDLSKSVTEMLERVAGVRGLSPRAKVRSAVLSRAELLARVRKHIAEQMPRDVIRNQGEILVALGLIAPDYDYEEGTLGLLEGQLAGFFEPSDKTMYLAADLPEEAVLPTLAHEMVHALQDQHFELGQKMSYQPEANDRESAIQSLAEGDATSVMMDVMLDGRGSAVDVSDDLLANGIEMSMALQSSSAKVPRVLRASLLAPYIDGVRFVHALRRRGDWRAVDDVWRDPPETTEQILHLEKLDVREKAEPVDVPASPDPEKWKAIYDDVFGEQGLRVAIGEWMPSRAAAVAASGWAGDRAVLYQQGSRFAIAWRVRFDRAWPADPGAWAQRAFRAIANGIRPGVAGKSVCKDRGAVGPLAVEHRGRDLVLAAGPYRREGARVSSDANCTQTARWAADILAGRSR
jgi:hypothetical protein